VLEARHGPQVARDLGKVALEGAAIIRQRVARHGIACDLVDGGLGVALTAQADARSGGRGEVWADHGHGAITVLDRAALRDHVRSTAMSAAFSIPCAAISIRSTSCWARLPFEALGGRLFEYSRVRPSMTAATSRA
jgi:gamma-glutamylputrescine oxidase